MTKLEQVARAIQRSDFEDAGIPWEKINPEGQSDYLKYACAAVGAMRDPNEHQYNTLAATNKLWRDMNSEFVWRTYIDAILSEKPE